MFQPAPVVRLCSAMMGICLGFAAADIRAQANESGIDEATPIQFRLAVDAPRPYEKLLESSLDLARWQGTQRVTAPLLQRLVAEARVKAAEALAAEGYFSAKVDARIDMTSKTDAVVRLAVELGPRTRVRNLDIDVGGAAARDPQGRKRVDAIIEGWSLGRGEAFQQKEWAAAKADALARLARAPYAAARITDSEARIDPETQSADLALKLDSGPVFHAGDTAVTGLKRYPAAVVKNMNPFGKGEPYDGLKLDLFQRRLLETGYFNAVQFTIDPDPAQSSAAPLHVSVIEAPSQRIDTSIIYNTDTGPGLTVDYGNVDVFDSAWRLRSVVKLNAKEQTGNVTFDTPPRSGGVWNTYRTSLTRTDIENQISREGLIGAAHNWGLQSLPSQVELSARYEALSISGSPTENNYAVFAGYRKTFRTTEELLSPRRGLIGTLEAGASVPGLASRQFARGRAYVNWLIPAGVRNDILIRGELGVVLASSRSGIPSSFRFRTGGDQTIRGYAYQSIGVAQGDAIVGGRYLALASAEYTRWITDSLGAAVFADAGDAFDGFDEFRLAAGYGLGVRWRSPVGPFRADVAYGQRTHKVRLHFSVGYTL